MTISFDDAQSAISIMPSLSRTVRACLRLHVGMKYYFDGQTGHFVAYCVMLPKPDIGET